MTKLNGALFILLICCISRSNCQLFDEETFSRSLLESFNVSRECKVSYRDFKDRLSRPEELLLKDAQWALKMYDAYGKFPQEGFLSGNFWSMGNPHSCMEVDALTPDRLGRHDPFKGKYCLVQPFTVPLNGAVSVDRDRVEREFEKGVMRGRPPTLTPGFAEKWKDVLGFPLTKFGLCVPSSCSDTDVRHALRRMELSLATKENFYAFIVTTCHTEEKEKPVYTAEDIAMFCVFGVFLFASFLGLVADFSPFKKSPAIKVLTPYSPRVNFLGLITNPPPGRDHITCLNGIRVFSMAWVIVAHMYMRTFQVQPVNNLVSSGLLGDFANGLSFRVVLNGYPSVDSFLAMSGLLVSYLTLKEMDRAKGWLNVPMFYLHRFIRLSGLYGIVILFHVSLLRYLDYGPVDIISPIQVKMCQESWWKNLVYVNNFYVDEGTCLGQCWYLAVDMQLFWASPLVLIPLWWIHQKKGVRWGLAWCAAWAAAMTGVLLTLHLVNDWPASDTTDTQNSTFIMENYYMPWCRCQPYIVGLATGYLLHISRGKPFKMPRWLCALAWMAAVGAGVGVVFGLDIYEVKTSGVEPSAVARAAYDSLSRLAWGLSMCWLMFACTKGYGGIVNRVLSWEAFGPLAKLSFATYLGRLHLSVGVYVISFLTFDYGATHAFISIISIVVYTFSTVLSVPVFVLLEVPLIVTEKLLFGAVFKAVAKLGGKGKKKET